MCHYSPYSLLFPLLLTSDRKVPAVSQKSVDQMSWTLCDNYLTSSLIATYFPPFPPM